MSCDPVIVANVLEEVAAEVSGRLDQRDETVNFSIVALDFSHFLVLVQIDVRR